MSNKILKKIQSQFGKSGNKKMNFLRKKKNEPKDADPEQDYGIRFNTNKRFNKRFLSSGRPKSQLYGN